MKLIKLILYVLLILGYFSICIGAGVLGVLATMRAARDLIWLQNLLSKTLDENLAALLLVAVGIATMIFVGLGLLKISKRYQFDVWIKKEFADQREMLRKRNTRS